MMRSILHMALHLLAPGIAARVLRPGKWLSAWLVMLSALLIDLDHLLADPVFDPNRCSINFHPLHAYPAIGLYVILTLIPRTRLIGVGLCLHIGLDALDCLMMGI